MEFKVYRYLLERQDSKMADSYKALIVLPNQLFYDSRGIKCPSDSIPSSPMIYDYVCVVEHPSFFITESKDKIVLLRSCMKAFYDNLEMPKTYIDYADYNINEICKNIHKRSPKATTIYIANPEDFDIFQELDKIKYKIKVHTSRLFIIPFEEILQDTHEDIISFSTHYIKKYNLQDFLVASENPAEIVPEECPISSYQKEALEYAKTDKSLNYCWDSRKTLMEVLTKGFSKNVLPVHPTHLFTIMDTGLITPWDAINILRVTHLNITTTTQLIRMLFGREYYRSKYVKFYNKEISNTPIESRRMSKAFATGTTTYPVFNDIINNIKSTGLPLEHQVLSCFKDITLLCQIHLKDVYDWLMQHLVNSYPWYVFGMIHTEFRCDALVAPPYIMTTSEVQDVLKHIASSNVLVASDWSQLVMLFINTHDNLMQRDVRTRIWKKKKAKNKKIIIEKANLFLDKLG